VWGRGHQFGKGFHQVSQLGFHNPTKGVISKAIVQNVDFGNYEGPFEPGDTVNQYASYPLTSPILTINHASSTLPGGYWFTNNFFNGASSRLGTFPWCLEFNPDILNSGSELQNALDSNIFAHKPFTSVSNINFVSDGDGPNVQKFTFPNFMILPLDNAGITITEPYTNEFPPDSGTRKTYTETATINGVTNAGLQIARDANTYRLMSTARAVVRGIAGGATGAIDLAATPLRPVIDAFPGITAADVKGMLLLFAFSQQIDGMTTGLLSTWHVGLGATTSSIGMAASADISNVDGLNANGPTSGSSTNVANLGIPVVQILYGFKTEFDIDPAIERNGTDPNFSLGSGLTACVYENYGRSSPLPYASSVAIKGAQAVPFLQSEIPLIRDFIFKKTESQ
jgi:hypothetical protein